MNFFAKILKNFQKRLDKYTQCVYDKIIKKNKTNTEEKQNEKDHHQQYRNRRRNLL